jgi:manganese-dependent ADP-ribose/CDP-alcohol diphosphatase
MMAGCATQSKPLTFSVIADVQYADKDTKDGRYYRNSLSGLVSFVQQCNQQHVDFAIQLGDLIDGGDNAGRELDCVLTVYDKLNCPHYHVLGNHDFEGIGRRKLLKRLGLERGYYTFEKKGVRFIVLDTQDIAIQGGWPKDSAQYKKSEEVLQTLTEQKKPNAQLYNGGLGNKQLVWLDEVLENAEKKNQDVIVFGHLPLWPDTDRHIAWNAAEVRKIFERYGCVRAYLCGHVHFSGYAMQNGIHYLTLPAAVNDSSGKTWATVQIWPDKVEIKGTGNVEDKILMFENKTSIKN